MFKKLPVQDSSDGPLREKSYLKIRIKSHQDSRKSSGYASGGSTNSRKKLGATADGIPDVLQSSTSSKSSSSDIACWYTSPISTISGEALLPIGLCLIL